MLLLALAPNIPNDSIHNVAPIEIRNHVHQMNIRKYKNNRVPACAYFLFPSPLVSRALCKVCTERLNNTCFTGQLQGKKKSADSVDWIDRLATAPFQPLSQSLKFAKNERNVVIIVVTIPWVLSYSKDTSKDSFILDDTGSLVYDHVLFFITSLTCFMSLLSQ